MFNNNKLKIALSSALIMIVMTIPVVNAETKNKDLIQKTQHGEVNWSKNLIVATGSGAAKLKGASAAVIRLNAERAATMDAYRNLLEALKGVKVSGKKDVGDLFSNGKIKANVSGVIRMAKRVDIKYYDDGSVDVTYSMPIDQSVTSPMKLNAKKKVKVSTKGQSIYTGMLINAKGLKIQPALAPKIVDEKGKAVFSASHVSDKALEVGGTVDYSQELENARKSEFLGDKPLVIKALSLAKGSQTDLVISNADAQKLRQKNSNLSFLHDGKVMIVID